MTGRRVAHLEWSAAMLSPALLAVLASLDTPAGVRADVMRAGHPRPRMPLGLRWPWWGAGVPKARPVLTVISGGAQ